MHSPLRIIGILFVFAIATVAWLGLGGITHTRTTDSADHLRGEVSSLWGRPHAQRAPRLLFQWNVEEERTETIEKDGKKHTVKKRVTVTKDDWRSPASTRVTASLSEDLRRKGLVWYPLYDVDFAGEWTYVHERPEAGWLSIHFDFPDQQGFYDGFSLVVDGVDRASELTPKHGQVVFQMPVQPGQEVALSAGYKSRGMEAWSYRPADGVASLEDFALHMETDFADIDFPAGTMSPSHKERLAARSALHAEITGCSYL